MLKNYFKIALRNLWKHKGYSAINIAGLSIGLASCLLIITFITEELSYDRFHDNAERIYRVGHEVSLGTGTKPIASTSHRLGSTLPVDFPELEHVVRFSRLYGHEVKYKDKKFREERISFVDSAFLKVFSFELIIGNSETALLKPNSVVITQNVAQRYFGDANPIGQILTIGEPYGSGDIEAEVTGIMHEMPGNSHFHMDLLISMATGKELFPESLYQNWGWDSGYTYVVLPENLSPTQFESRLLDFGEKHIEGDWFIKFFLQPLTDIHLYSNLNSEIEANSKFIYIQIFSAVALIIIIIACVNYINLAIAKSSKRSREVGIRKAIGAYKQQIAFQFLGESLFIVTISIILAGLLAELSITYFNEILAKNLEVSILDNLSLLIIFIVLSYVVGILSGIYPAFYLSSFNTTQVLKGTITKLGNGALFLRKGLVVFQFIISIGLIVGTLIVYSQWQFLRNKELGADVQHTIVFPATDAIAEKFVSFKTELLRNPNITHAATSFRRLGRDINSGTMMTAEVDGEQNQARLSTLLVGYDFLEMYEVELISGRYFSRDFATDSLAIIFNRAALKALGIKSPEEAIGQIARYRSDIDNEVVGVIEDFHFETLYNKIKPMVFFLIPDRGMSWISVKANQEDMQETLAFIEGQWKTIENKRDFRYSFLREDLYNLYITEERFLSVFTIFTGLAIFTACLGIFGLSSFTILQRAKEISIRKVLGCSISKLSFLITWDFVKLILISSIIAFPLAFFSMRYWLRNFEYRVEMTWWTFAIAAIFAIVIAGFTVGFKALRAALANPIDSLKEE
ncbi:ABC transporter permease [Fulvivirgaceae bacterium BMA10]|uniref:ABC transporter permease n=1 Tax=Splendidivirga corallicola TaxID=3051826 RepID=A0ABT8KX02_9BACT|nr:ABC transporter permease [Fulvivirgaceae bacterium BMA10]